MNTQTQLLRKTALAAAVTIVVSGVASVGDFAGLETGMSPFVSTAYAGDGGSGNGQKGAMGEGRGGQGDRGAGGQGHKGGRSVADVLADDDGDDDSDRPDWAGVPGGEGRPGGGGNPNPGDTKGDEFGDMIALLRDPVTGVPVEIDGELQVCTTADCSSYEPMDDGEVPPGVTPIEVDLGRASLVRMPSAVIDRRLDEALSLLTADGAVITQDDAGRIVVVLADGTTKTIDSPLENLALYIDLMEGLADAEKQSDTEAALEEANLDNLKTAASLLGTVADKTGDISLDFYMAVNMISDLDTYGDDVNDPEPSPYYDYLGTFTYDRVHDEPYVFLYLEDGATVPVSATMDIDDYLAHVNGEELPTGSAALFAAAADDALEVVELLHTQVVTEEFLDGFDAFVINQPNP